MSLLNKHIVELLTENQFTTVSVYFRTEADDVAGQAPQAPKAAPHRTQYDRMPAPPPWGASPPDLNEMTDAELKTADFPFITRSLPSKQYIYKCSKEMAALLKQGDPVVVSSKNGQYMVARVWQVHATAQIDYNALHPYRWLVQRLDTTEFDNHMQRERQFLAMLEESEKERQRQAVRQTMLDSIRPTDPAMLEAFKNGLVLLGVAPSAAGLNDTIDEAK